jgi:hypothetical protein
LSVCGRSGVCESQANENWQTFSDLRGADDANASSTYEYINSNFEISYADGTGAAGDYVKDNIGFGGETIPGLQFGVGYISTSSEGVLGIGYPSREAQVVLEGAQPYANLPQLMVDQGLIRSKAYSLWLNDLSASTGSILFGGVNTEKYVGQLATLPIQVRPGQPEAEEFFLTLTGIEYGDRALGGDRADAVLLDSGSSLIYLPDDLTLEIYNTVDATIDPRRGVAVVPCSSANLKETLKFSFSGVTISVDMTELVLPGSSTRFASTGEAACTFGILPAGTSTPVMGDPFLRSAYIVYDIDNDEISLAQTNFNSTTDRILEIGTGPEAVPDARDVLSPKKADPGHFGGGRIRPTATTEAAPSPTASQKGGAVSGREVPMTALAAVVLGALGVSLAL